MFGDEKHSDFTIICNGDKEQRKLLAHKVVLDARSPVFSAMFKHDTEEAQRSEVHYNDIDFEVYLLYFLF